MFHPIVHAIQFAVGLAGAHGNGVDVHTQRVPGPELERSDRQDARPAAQVQQMRALDPLQARQHLQAAGGGFVLPGAKGAGGHDEVNAPVIEDGNVGRDDAKTLSHLERNELPASLVSSHLDSSGKDCEHAGREAGAVLRLRERRDHERSRPAAGTLLNV